MVVKLTSSKPSNRKQATLWELAAIYSRLGTVGFGGPQAHIAMQNSEVVSQRQWLTQEQFVEGLAVCEMLPGPASTQMGIYIGYVVSGPIGALVAGLSFIAPAFAIVLALSWAYFQFQQTPQLEGIFLGVSPVVVALILGFCWKLMRKTVLSAETSRRQRIGRWMIAIAVFVTTLLARPSILLQLLVAGLVGLWLFAPSPPRRALSTIPGFHIAWLNLELGFVSLSTASTEVVSLSSLWGFERIGTYFWPLTLFFLKVGSSIFGGGLVIIPFIETEVVEKLHWLTTTEFLNGVAIGQLSPGPVVLTAAFVGYKVAGLLGGLVAAIAIFLPSFTFIMLASPILARLRRNPRVRAFLQGVTPAVLGAIAAAAIPLAQNALDQPTLLLQLAVWMILTVALVALLKYRVPTWLLVPGGGLVGLLLSLSGLP
ncbi:MAG: chromate efflux transporter [Cyanobacteria bacterium P01_E01_bin.34]